MTANVQAVWFKRDLRLHDNRALFLAAQNGPVLPFFVAETELWRQSDMSARQWGFVGECLNELRRDLASIGQSLIIKMGNTPDVLAKLHSEIGISALWSHEETGNAWTYERDKQVAAWCRENGIPWTEEKQNGVVRGLTNRDGWASRWDGFMAKAVTPAPGRVQCPKAITSGHIPAAAELGIEPDHCPWRQRGGREEALATLESFLTNRGENYRKAMSSPNTAFEACSRLSPHIAWGTISMREVAHATNKRRVSVQQESDAKSAAWRGSLTSFAGRLHWHCHFMQKLENQTSIEFANLHHAYNDMRGGPDDSALLNAWSRGETGLPFVDACMRALNATGWLNFRMRAMLMAVASYHLWLDWRAPGEHLARQFTDYEPGIHWPQVQMQSGTSGINTVRIYNPVKQGFDQDPEGTFVRRWVPELADVPDQYLQEPWLWEGASRLLDKAYPRRIVDHVSAAKAARQKIWAVRADPAYRSVAQAIQEKHGSRKSGVRGVARKRKARQGNTQLALDL